MKIGIRTGSNKTFAGRISELAKSLSSQSSIEKAGSNSHKYIKREGTPGHYKYYYRLPNGSMGTKAELKAAKKGKKQVVSNNYKPGEKVMYSPYRTEGSTGREKPTIVTIVKQHRGDVVIRKDNGEEIRVPDYDLIKPKKPGIRKPDGENDAGEVKRGDKASGVDVNGKKVSGTVTAVGNDGFTIDHEFHVEHGKAKRLPRAKTKGKWDEEKRGQLETPSKSFVAHENFKASDWSKQWADDKATPDDAGVEHILKSFGQEGEEIAKKIKDIEGKLKGRPMTIQKYRISGEGESARYTEEREKLHGRIMQELLHPDKLRAALPPLDEKPTFMLLGGRGGSGKSWFKGNMYDPLKYVILDADEIKSKLPEYEGWNAADVHEESSDILEQMITTCIKNGLNVVLDGTMKSSTSALAKVFRAKAAGYRTEAHYMHLPAHEAAKRVIGRFKNDGDNGPFTGRFIPVDVILKNTTNEDSFDQVRGLVDNWSFRDNNVMKKGDPPIVVSHSEKTVKKSYAALVKNIQQAYN